MMDIRQIDAQFAVSPQIDPADVTEAARAGFVAIVNNRPDGEDEGQPDGAAIRLICDTLGLGYAAIPVTHAGFSLPQIASLLDTIAAADGPVLAYCRSGTRSCHLWALAAAKRGDDPDAIAAKAAAAGYDVSPLRPLIDQLAAAR